MRIAVHDYCGHPFPVQLSRELAKRGHAVLHLYSPTVQSPRGDLEVNGDDPSGFAIAGVKLDRAFEKYRPWQRVRQEWMYGRRLVREVRRFGPDVILSGNTPLLSQREVIRAARSDGVRVVFWQQDVLSIGIKSALRQRAPFAGTLIGRGFETLEASLLRRSDAVVAISEDFVPWIRAAGANGRELHVIENWAPLEELPVRPRDNAWARRHDLVGRPVLLYAGTLGLKHDPTLLLHLAEELQPDGVTVVVVSDGIGSDRLRAATVEREVPNLRLLPFQPYAALPDVLASGDVLVAVLERGAGTFSVPSKILSYFCAGRPVLAAVPSGNLAARLVERSGAGRAIDPSDRPRLVEAARALLRDPRAGSMARSYAERTFDLTSIADRFESILSTGSVAAPTPAHL